MGLVRSLSIALFIVLVTSNSYARTIGKGVTVDGIDKQTLSELDRYLEDVNGAINDNAIRSICWYVDGTVATGASQGRTYSNYPFDFLPYKIRLHVDTAPTDADLIIDINNDGTTIFGTKAEIDGAATEQDGNEVFVSAEIENGSDISLDIDQVGSTIAGADLTVCLYGRVT